MATISICQFVSSLSSQFGKAVEEIAKESGKEFLNFKWSDHGGETEDFGVTYEDGISALLLGGLITKYHWIDDMEAEQISCQKAMKNLIIIKAFLFSVNTSLEEMTEPVESPSCPYPLRPESQGKLIWVTGMPGTGKSTTAQLLARNHGKFSNYHQEQYLLSLFRFCLL